MTREIGFFGDAVTPMDHDDERWIIGTDRIWPEVCHQIANGTVLKCGTPSNLPTSLYTPSAYGTTPLATKARVRVFSTVVIRSRAQG